MRGALGQRSQGDYRPCGAGYDCEREAEVSYEQGAVMSANEWLASVEVDFGPRIPIYAVATIALVLIIAAIVWQRR